MHQDNHSHNHHDIPHDHNDHHDHHSHFHLKDDTLMEEALDEVQRSLRGSSIRLGKRRELVVATDYSYQVDIYIEIDNQLCIDNGEDCQANGLENSPNTVNYGKYSISIRHAKVWMINRNIYVDMYWH